LTAAAGGLAVVLAAPAIVRGAENMGKWAVATRAGATAAAMSITHFSQLQGALELSGKKADSADGNLRRFARTVGEAIADPASKSAQALHNFGLTQAEIVEHSQDVFPLLVKMADGFREYGTGATTAQNATKAFGQGWENIAAVLTGGGQNLLDLMNKAKDLGGTLTDETEPGVEATGRAAEELGKSVKREATQAFIEWAPTIEKIINLLGWLGHAINKTVSAIHSLATTIATMPLTGEWAYIPPVPDDLKDAAKKLGAGVPSDVTLETTVTAARRKSMAPLGGAKELSEQAAAARAHMQLMVAEARHNAGAIAAAYDEYIGKLKSIYGEGSRQVEAAEAQKLRAVESAENRGAAAAKRATREAFAEYSAKEREKVAAAEGNFAEITAIYNEWLAHTKAVWGEHSKEYQTVLREMVEATNRFKLEAVRAMREVGEAQLRSARLDFEFKMETESGMAPQVRRHTEAQQALEEAQKIGTAALEQIRVLESVAKSANASAKTQEEAQHEILMISNDAKEKIIADMRTWADYAKAEATKLAKLFEGVFDRLGGQFESFSDSLVKALLAPQRELYRAGFTTIQESMRGNEIRTAMRSLLLGAINDVMKSIETGLTSLLARTLSGGVYDTMSQVLGNALSKVVGNLFGGAAGGAVGGIFGGAAGSAPTVAAITAQTTALTTAIASSTAAIVSAVQAAAIVEAATPKPLGFAAGGIVPSAQGGMVVGGATLSLLHPREMVLPAHISEGLQRMIGGAGGGGVNYSPTITPARRPLIVAPSPRCWQRTQGRSSAM
jgi:hypothetical protein